MERRQKFGYRFNKVQDADRRAELAVNVIFEKIPFDYLIELEKCLFNGSGLELRKSGIKNRFKEFFKYGGQDEGSRTVYGIFKVDISRQFLGVLINTEYQPYYRSVTKDASIIQDVRIFTGIETKFVFEDYEC